MFITAANPTNDDRKKSAMITTPELDAIWALPAADWDAANCRTLGELFFSDQIPDIVEAKHICTTCSLMETCLEGAIERREPWGVWGGELFLNGKILAHKRRRGRPPKHPRPEGVELTA